MYVHICLEEFACLSPFSSWVYLKASHGQIFFSVLQQQLFSPPVFQDFIQVNYMDSYWSQTLESSFGTDPLLWIIGIASFDINEMIKNCLYCQRDVFLLAQSLFVYAFYCVYIESTIKNIVVILNQSFDQVIPSPEALNYLLLLINAISVITSLWQRELGSSIS